MGNCAFCKTCDKCVHYIPKKRTIGECEVYEEEIRQYTPACDVFEEGYEEDSSKTE